MVKMDKKHEKIEKPRIDDEDGLNISYDKEELKKYYPHLLEEISTNEKSISINSVEMKVEKDKKNIDGEKTHIPRELINPGALDFIRRCRSNDEAIEILNFLLKRKEISEEDYNSIKIKISKPDGLKNLIKESGGFKRPGYYERKYYKKDFSNQKFKKQN